MKKGIILFSPIIILFLLLFNYIYIDSISYDLIIINLFLVILVIFIFRSKNYFVTKSAIYIGLLMYYIFGMIMSYNVSLIYSDSTLRPFFIISILTFIMVYVTVYEINLITIKEKIYNYVNIKIIYYIALFGLFVPIFINFYLNTLSFGSIKNALFMSYALKTFDTSNYILYMYHLIIPSYLIVYSIGKIYKYKTKLHHFLLASGFVLTFLVMILTKSRGNILEFILSVLIAGILLNEKQHIKSLTMKIKILSITFATFILIILVGLVRNYNLNSDKVTLNKSAFEKNLLGSFDAMDVYYYILESMPSEHVFLYGRSFLSTFISFIPRSMWESKPVSFGNEIMIYKYGAIIPNYAVAPSYIGEWYGNFGFIGILIGATVLGVITKLIDSKKYSKQDVFWIVYIIISLFYFWRLMRGDFQSSTIPYLIKSIYILLLFLIAKSKYRIR